jgi:hypothetical protein
MFNCRVWVTVNGTDESWQGMLELPMPFPPFTSLEITCLHVTDPMVIDTVMWDPQQLRFDVYCLPIRGEKKATTLMRRFVGDWGWEPACFDPESDAPIPPPDDAPAGKQTAKEKSDEVLRRILEGRARDLPKNPSEQEKS